MEREIKAIETEYAGYKFRSRTEARWAVFFDALGFKWQYEEEGYELPNGRWYLPDFKIITPMQEMYYCEVKPIEFNLADEEVYDYRLFTKLVNHPIIILTGQPNYGAYASIYPEIELPMGTMNDNGDVCLGEFTVEFFQDYKPFVKQITDDEGYWFNYFEPDEETGHWNFNSDERAAKKAFGKKYVDAIKAAKMERFDKR